MYLYLYDNFLREKKYEATIRSVENRLTDFGIAGKIMRLSSFTNAKSIIDDEMARGVTTVVIVGNDETFGHVLSRAAACQVTFGFLPIGPDNTIAQVLGLPLGEDACEVLSRRRKVSLDVGWVNNRYFISKLHIAPSQIAVAYDEKFVVKPRNGKMELVVCNLQPFVWKRRQQKDIVVHPQDGKLEAFLRPLEKKNLFSEIYEEPSIFPFEEMIVASKTPFLVEADGKQTKETQLKIKLAKKRIEMIVGRTRKF